MYMLVPGRVQLQWQGGRVQCFLFVLVIMFAYTIPVESMGYIKDCHGFSVRASVLNCLFLVALPTQFLANVETIKNIGNVIFELILKFSLTH